MIKSLETEIISAEDQINIIEDKFLSGGIEGETFNRMNKRYMDRLMDLKSELEMIKNSRDDSS